MQLTLLNAPRVARKPARAKRWLRLPKTPKKAAVRIIPRGWTMPLLSARRSWARRFLDHFTCRRFLTQLEPLEGAEHLIPAEALELDGWRFSADGLVFWTPTGWSCAIPEFMAAIPPAGPLITPAAMVRLIEITQS
jgi:hypothetical protein